MTIYSINIILIFFQVYNIEHATVVAKNKNAITLIRKSKDDPKQYNTTLFLAT
jgi:hypothetical protein